MPRQAISGLKYCQGLCLLRLRQPLGPGTARLCRELARQRINLTLLSGLAGQGRQGEVCLCLAEDYLGQAWQAARELDEGQAKANPEVIAPVAALTIYPLGPGLALCWRVLAGLIGSGLNPLALSTSLSGLVTVLPQEDLPAALEALEMLLRLPPGVRPSSQQLKVVQVPAQTKA